MNKARLQWTDLKAAATNIFFDWDRIIKTAGLPSDPLLARKEYHVPPVTPEGKKRILDSAKYLAERAG